MRLVLAILVAVVVGIQAAAIASSDVSVGDPALNVDPRYNAVTARAEDGSGRENGNYAAPIAGPGGEMTGTIVSDTGSGPTDFYVGAVDEKGNHRFWKGRTDNNGRFHFRAPLIVGLTAVLLFKHFDPHGKPDDGATTLITRGAAHLEDTGAVKNIPASGPAIVEARTSYERGGISKGLVPLRIREVDPLRARVLLDGSDRSVDTLAASDQSVLGRLHDDAVLGRHSIVVQSGDHVTNSQTVDVVAIHFDPLGPLHTGQIKAVHLHIEGLGTDPATVTFTVSGAATLSDGGKTRTVPVHDGQAECEIRGEHPGQLIVRTLLDVAIAEELSKTPPLPSESASPIAVGKIVPCEYKVTDGYMQPTQGFWQDDKKFPYPDILIRLGSPGDEPSYKAPYPLVVNRWTVIGGVYRYHWNLSGKDSVPDDRDDPKGHIHMLVSSNCPDPDTVRFHFALVNTNAGTVWRNDTQPLGTVPLHGMVQSGTPLKGYSVDLPAPLGYPRGSAFRAPAPGFYTLFCELEKRDAATGQWKGPLGEVTVNVQMVVTHGPLIHFVPAVAYPTADTNATGMLLSVGVARMAYNTSHLLPDLYPVVPGGDMTTSSIPSVVDNFIDLTSNDIIQNPQNHLNLPHNVNLHHDPEVQQFLTTIYGPPVVTQAIRAEIARLYNLDAVLKHAGRIVVVFDAADFEKLVGRYVAAKTLSNKVILAPDDASYETIGHEIAHTLPWDAKMAPAGQDVPWMNNECQLGYHNLPDRSLHGHEHDPYDYAQGLRFIQNGGQVDRRVDVQGTVGLMGPETGLSIYMEQCTSRHLTNYLRGIPDPPVIVVRGMLLTNGHWLRGFFDPFYRATSQLDVQAEDPVYHLRLLLRASDGEVLQTIPMQSNIFGPEDKNFRPISAFMMRVPIIAGLHSIELWSGRQKLATQSSTPFAPRVTILAPRSGASIYGSAPFSLTWSARGAPGSVTSAAIFDSIDGGKSFDILAVDEAGPSYRLHLHGAGRHVLRVIVSDGWQTGEADTAVVVH